MADCRQVDAVVDSVTHQGFFGHAGPLKIFVSQHVSLDAQRRGTRLMEGQMIPNEIKWDPNATPPQYTNNDDTVIEKDSQVRVKLVGTRNEVGGMWAIGSIKEDYLGYDIVFCVLRCMLTGEVVLESREPPDRGAVIYPAQGYTRFRDAAENARGTRRRAKPVCGHTSPKLLSSGPDRKDIHTDMARRSASRAHELGNSATNAGLKDSLMNCKKSTRDCSRTPVLSSFILCDVTRRY